MRRVCREKFARCFDMLQMRGFFDDKIYFSLLPFSRKQFSSVHLRPLTQYSPLRQGQFLFFLKHFISNTPFPFPRWPHVHPGKSVDICFVPHYRFGIVACFLIRKKRATLIENILMLIFQLVVWRVRIAKPISP